MPLDPYQCFLTMIIDKPTKELWLFVFMLFKFFYRQSIKMFIQWSDYYHGSKLEHGTCWYDTPSHLLFAMLYVCISMKSCPIFIVYQYIKLPRFLVFVVIFFNWHLLHAPCSKSLIQIHFVSMLGKLDSKEIQRFFLMKIGSQFFFDMLDSFPKTFSCKK